MAQSDDIEDDVDEGQDDQVPDKDGWLDLMNGLIRKRVLVEGTGSHPEMKSDVICSYKIRVADGSADEVLQHHRNVRLRIGEGEAVPALELGLRHMLPGEECEVRGAARMAWGTDGLLAVGAEEKAVTADVDVILQVTLHSCMIVDGEELEWKDKMLELKWRKDNGNDHFRRKQFIKARRCYAACIEVFQGMSDTPADLPNREAALDEAVNVVADCGANMAAVHLEMDAPTAAKDACTVVLQLRPDHVKAIYRGAKACYLLDDFDECEVALQRAQELEPDNIAVKRLQADLKKKRYKYATKSQRMATRLFAGMHEERTPEAGEGKTAASQSESLPRLFQSALAATIQEWWRWIAAGILLLGSLVMLCCVLPSRHWPKVFIGYFMFVPILAALVAANTERLAEEKKEE